MSFTIDQVATKYSHYTIYTSEIIQVYNLTKCPTCANVIMDDGSMYIEREPSVIDAIVGVLKNRGLSSLEDPPDEIDWVLTIPMHSCWDCEYKDKK